jgi:hypothetical protein
MAVPPIVAYHPDGNVDRSRVGREDPLPDDRAQRGREAAVERHRRGSVNSGGSSGLEEKGTVKREWEFEFLEPKNANVSTSSTSAFNYLDVMKLRSLWVPEQAFIEGEGGTSVTQRGISDG